MKKTIGFLTGLFLIGTIGIANAATITTNFTGDNIVDALYLDGTEVPFASVNNLDDWTAFDSVTLDLTDNQNHQLVWQVSNLNGVRPTNAHPSTGNNPAAFLGDITGDIVGGTHFSSSSWLVSTSNGPLGDFNDPAWSWASATTFGDNSNDPNIWRDIAGISGASNWIWSSGADVSVFIRADFTTAGAAAPVPEPATMILLGVGLMGIAGFGRKKLQK